MMPMGAGMSEAVMANMMQGQLGMQPPGQGMASLLNKAVVTGTCPAAASLRVSHLESLLARVKAAPALHYHQQQRALIPPSWSRTEALNRTCALPWDKWPL